MPADQPRPFDRDAPDASARLEAAGRGVAALPRRRDQLLPALLAAQQVLDWLPREAITLVAEHVRVPVSEVYATVMGYSELRLERPVPGAWRVCTGVACDLGGARELLDALGAALPGRAAGTDCQFLCALAPVAVDPDERLHGRVTADRIAALARAEAPAERGAT
ncbi:MAG: NAD(P)H-dependent oxidoreductase subunit E [Dehalococcoidia bacterium]